MKYPPIIILGMHRSGTTLLTKCLSGLGLFVGEDIDPADHETSFFNRLNLWILKQGGGRWDNPDPVYSILNNEELRGFIVDCLRYYTASRRCSSYLGFRNFLRYGGFPKLDFPWGWKDPRNTFTLPLWLEVFPGARIIHIFRNGVDVANSLRERERKSIVRAKAEFARKKKDYFFRVRTMLMDVVDSARCHSLEGGFSLWELYLEKAREHVEALGERAIEIRYEDFLESPEDFLGEIAGFCGLRVDRESMASVTEKIDRSRAYAYKRNRELVEFERRVRSRLESKGY